MPFWIMVELNLLYVFCHWSAVSIFYIKHYFFTLVKGLKAGHVD